MPSLNLSLLANNQPTPPRRRAKLRPEVMALAVEAVDAVVAVVAVDAAASKPSLRLSLRLLRKALSLSVRVPK